MTPTTAGELPQCVRGHDLTEVVTSCADLCAAARDVMNFLDSAFCCKSPDGEDFPDASTDNTDIAALGDTPKDSRRNTHTLQNAGRPEIGERQFLEHLAAMHDETPLVKYVALVKMARKHSALYALSASRREFQEEQICNPERAVEGHAWLPLNGTPGPRCRPPLPGLPTQSST